MKKLLEQYPFFLFLLPAFIIIHLEKELHKLIDYGLVYDRIIFLFVAPVIFWLVFYLTFRSWRKSALMTLAFLVFFYLTGDLKNWLTQKLPGTVWQSYSFLFVFMLIILLLVFIRLKKTKSALNRSFFIFNIVLLFFIAADIIQIFLTGDKGRYQIVSSSEKSLRICDTCTRPDIYYIIFDAYSSSGHLQRHYNYSNLALEDNLENKGFRIISNSKSNYNYTAFSIGSALNMNYIENVDTIHRTFDRAYLQALKLVHTNRVFSFLRENGYRIFNHSLFDTDSVPTTLKNADPWGFREIYDQYNLIFKLQQDIGHKFPSKAKKILEKNKLFVNSPENRNRIDSTILQHLLYSVKLESPDPKFIYAHFLKPHPPFFQDSLGNALQPGMRGQEAYVHQVAYVNRIIEKVTDSIMMFARRPLVIIIQGDHGYSYENARKKPQMFSNLNAIFFSNKDYRLLNDSLTSVNTFRIVFNTFFRTDMKLLPDRFYYLLQ